MKYRYAFVIEDGEIAFEYDYSGVSEETCKQIDMVADEYEDDGRMIKVITVIVEYDDG